jgi:hypothetical protein
VCLDCGEENAYGQHSKHRNPQKFNVPVAPNESVTPIDIGSDSGVVGVPDPMPVLGSMENQAAPEFFTQTQGPVPVEVNGTSNGTPTAGCGTSAAAGVITKVPCVPPEAETVGEIPANARAPESGCMPLFIGTGGV